MAHGPILTSGHRDFPAGSAPPRTSVSCLLVHCKLRWRCQAPSCHGNRSIAQYRCLPIRASCKPSLRIGLCVMAVHEHARSIIGVSTILIFGCIYAIFITSFLYALQIDTWLWIFGAVISIPLWILSGITFAYLRLLHPAIRNNKIPHPGPFALSKSKEAAIELLAAHIIFGAITSTIYAVLAGG